MSADFVFALYVFCMDYHSGQSSRLYRILSLLSTRYRVSLRDSHIDAIRYGKYDRSGEWETARTYYRQLKRSKYAKETC